MIYTILIIVLILALLGGIPTDGYGYGGYAHGGIVTLLLIVLVIWLLTRP